MSASTARQFPTLMCNLVPGDMLRVLYDGPGLYHRGPDTDQVGIMVLRVIFARLAHTDTVLVVAVEDPYISPWCLVLVNGRLGWVDSTYALQRVCRAG